MSDSQGELIREAQRRKDREEREPKLLAGVQSPTSEMTDEHWAALREAMLVRSPELREREDEPPGRPE